LKIYHIKKSPKCLRAFIIYW